MPFKYCKEQKEALGLPRKTLFRWPCTPACPSTLRMQPPRHKGGGTHKTWILQIMFSNETVILSMASRPQTRLNSSSFKARRVMYFDSTRGPEGSTNQAYYSLLFLVCSRVRSLPVVMRHEAIKVVCAHIHQGQAPLHINLVWPF